MSPILKEETCKYLIYRFLSFILVDKRFEISNHTLFADMTLIIRQADDFSKYGTTLI